MHALMYSIDPTSPLIEPMLFPHINDTTRLAPHFTSKEALNRARRSVSVTSQAHASRAARIAHTLSNHADEILASILATRHLDHLPVDNSIRDALKAHIRELLANASARAEMAAARYKATMSHMEETLRAIPETALIWADQAKPRSPSGAREATSPLHSTQPDG